MAEFNWAQWASDNPDAYDSLSALQRYNASQGKHPGVHTSGSGTSVTGWNGGKYELSADEAAGLGVPDFAGKSFTMDEFNNIGNAQASVTAPRGNLYSAKVGGVDKILTQDQLSTADAGTVNAAFMGSEGDKGTLYTHSSLGDDGKYGGLAGGEWAQVGLGVAGLAATIDDNKAARRMEQKRYKLDVANTDLYKDKIGWQEDGTTTASRVSSGLGMAFA